MFPIDHASLHVPSLDGAAGVLRPFGDRLVRTPTERSHARLYFDRGYLEVREQPGQRRWELSYGFLRFADAQAAEGELRGRGLSVPPRSRYVGVDGEWEELHPAVPDGAVPLPLVKRVTPAELAADWPPPRPGLRLSALYVRVPDLRAAEEHYARLTGGTAVAPGTLRFGTHELRLLRADGPAALAGFEVAGVDATGIAQALGEGGGGRVTRIDGRARVQLSAAPELIIAFANEG